MRSVLRVSIVALMAAGFCLAQGTPATAGCTGFSGTADGFDKQTAVSRSQGSLVNAIAKYKAEKRLRSISIRAMRAKPRPYWRDTVTKDLYRGSPIVTRRSYTVCWTGVISPFVCTSGAKVCW